MHLLKLRNLYRGATVNIATAGGIQSNRLTDFLQSRPRVISVHGKFPGMKA